MCLINRILGNFAKKKLGADFEERVMQALEEKSCSKDDAVSEIVEHYQAIIKQISPQYSCIRIDADNLIMITIDGIEYDLDNKSTQKLRKATEHRMAIECLLADFDNPKQVISQVEMQLNNNKNRHPNSS